MVRVMREYVWLECTVCGSRNYRTQKETRGADRLELKKFCRKERKHTPAQGIAEEVDPTPARDQGLA